MKGGIGARSRLDKTLGTEATLNRAKQIQRERKIAEKVVLAAGPKAL